MISRDLVGGVAAILIGVAYLYFASQLRTSALDDSFGPGGMPRAYGVMMIALGLLISLIGLVKQSRGREVAGLQAEWAGQGIRMLRAAGLLAIGIVYLLAVTTLGYPVAIALLLIAVALYQGANPGIRVVLIGVGGAIALSVIFIQLLGVSMPKGVLGIF